MYIPVEHKASSGKATIRTAYMPVIMKNGNGTLQFYVKDRWSEQEIGSGRIAELEFFREADFLNIFCNFQINHVKYHCIHCRCWIVRSKQDY